MTDRPFIYDPPQEPFLTILYQDKHLVAALKPAGLLSVPGKPAEHSDSLALRVQSRFPRATVVHRLDLATSGVIVMALNLKAHRHISMQFEKRETSKTYIARVWGHMQDDHGEVNLPMKCDWPNRPKQMVDYVEGRPALTLWDVVAREEENGHAVTRVSLNPITGRSHQLRVHMLSLGHPILGDDLYAHKDAYEAAPRMQLHAQSLTLRHPVTEEEMTFEAPCPF
ncbi:MAG: RNA pseudouridine synthase [Alphaproteobacteria bacterium]|nr:RNA pseudouridine synthase [Alphaproteobacteria bacterium]